MNFRRLSASLFCAALSVAAFEPTKALAATTIFQVDIENLKFFGDEGVRIGYGLGSIDSLTAYLQFDIDQTTGFTTFTRRSRGVGKELQYVGTSKTSTIERFVIDTPNGRIENTDGVTGGALHTQDYSFISEETLSSGGSPETDSFYFRDHGQSSLPTGWASFYLTFPHTPHRGLILGIAMTS